MKEKIENSIQKESHYRSIIKGITWRIIGTLDTMLLSFIITGKLDTALKIGFTEVFTKIFLFWLHERLWQLILVDKNQTPLISAIKTISWRIVGTLDTLIISWFYTGEFKQGASIASVEVITKLVLYYFHERAWLLVPKGSIRKIFKR